MFVCLIIVLLSYMNIFVSFLGAIFLPTWIVVYAPSLSCALLSLDNNRFDLDDSVVGGSKVLSVKRLVSAAS